MEGIMTEFEATQISAPRRALVSRRDVLGTIAKGSVLAGAGIALAACGSSHPSSALLTSTKPKRGGTLQAGIAGGGSGDTLNGNNAFTDIDWSRAFNLYNGLVEIAPDFTLQNSLAEEITPNPKATSWTIRLKQGIEFHNGKPLTADDVIFTFQRIWNPKLPFEGAGGLTYVDMKGLRKLDSLTVQVPMVTPLACFKEILADTFYLILPVGFDVKQPIGTGPFRYKSFTAGVSSTFTRNPNYWEPGLPYLDELVITDFFDTTSQVNAVISGAMDCVDSLSFAALPDLRNAGVNVLQTKSAQWTPIVMQQNLAPFTDNRVRLAMKLIVDRPAMIRSALDGYGQVANDFFGLYDPSYDAAIPQREQDIPQAKALLKAAGQSGLTVTLDTGAIANGVVQGATVFAQQAKAAGVNVRLNTMTPGNYFGPTYLHRPFSQSIWQGQYYLAQVTQSNLPSSPLNEPHFIDEHYAMLFSAANATLDRAKQNDIIHEMMLIDHDQGGYLIYAFNDIFDAYRSRVHGLVPNRTGWSLGGYRFKDVWLD
jgi:peptide/nickel transport system substrate-binding protein